MRLAIVGSTKFADPLGLGQADWIIRRALAEYRPEEVISGGAEGIDSLAEQIARAYGYNQELPGKRLIIHRPENRRWAPDGFKARNLLIAQDCTHLLAIRCKESRTYGSGWTADQAEKLGKTVWRELL